MTLHDNHKAYTYIYVGYHIVLVTTFEVSFVFSFIAVLESVRHHCHRKVKSLGGGHENTIKIKKKHQNEGVWHF
ncbi:MAG: hypothetical protein K2P53_00015 [Rickettsiales bacterium]|nr:hypothetical protein [Rickettsiales bacterium]